MPLSWIALNSVKGLGPVRIKHLLDSYGSPEEIFAAPRGELVRRGLLSREVAAQLADPCLMAGAEEQVRLAGRCGARILTLVDPDFPTLLKEIYAPPPVLYIRGDVGIFRKHAVGVVGTRRLTAYGERATAALVGDLARAGLAIVSGLAMGIDAVAHQTCLDAGGVTVAVLGTGIERNYPAANRSIRERIVEEGILVSEFPLGMPPEPYNFPRRNRIISGLSAGVIVVEAGQRSGALITAHYALQQGREVFAVPGPIFSDKSAGTLALLRSGATPVGSARDVVEALEVISAPVAAGAPSRVTQPPPELLSAGEREILGELSQEPLRMDQIAQKTKKVVSDLFDILLNLELKGLVQQVAGQQFVRA